MSNAIKPKIIVILGPTSSGKSGAAVRLAKKFNGEIISADSRQIYRGMDIGTGKVISDRPYKKSKTFISEGIPHYGINITSPKTNYNTAKFQKYARKAIRDILKKGKLPIICGGTGFWIKAIVDNVVYPEVRPDWKLRNELRNKSIEELYKILKKKDPDRAKTIDAKNPVRLIRAIEICKSIGAVPPISCHCERSEAISRLPRSLSSLAMTKKYEFLQIGISLPKNKLHSNIKKRLKERFDSGMIDEVEKLHCENKISWKRLESFGLGYALIPKYLKGEITSKNELFEKIYLAEKQYSKRQITWFKKDKRIVWLEKYRDIEKKAKKFLL